MITKEKFLDGIIAYIDNEIIPVLPTSNQWLIGTCVTIAVAQYPKYFQNLAENSVIQGLGIIQDNGLIDDVTLFTALHTSAQKYGKLSLTLPLMGTMAFSVKDVDKLRGYVKGDIQNDGRTEENDGSANR